MGKSMKIEINILNLSASYCIFVLPTSKMNSFECIHHDVTIIRANEDTRTFKPLPFCFDRSLSRNIAKLTYLNYQST